jgi:hypothetical protein
MPAGCISRSASAGMKSRWIDVMVASIHPYSAALYRQKCT